MSDRVCIRGCITRGEHADDCSTKDADTFPCRGCRPRHARHMAYVCDGCYSRFGKMLDDVADLLARLVSLDDPTKATPTDQEHLPGSGMAVAPPPVNDDRMDARIAIEANLRDWAAWADGVDIAEAAKLGTSLQASAVREHLDEIVNDRILVMQLSAAILDIHKPNEAGEREAWSVWDAVVKWKVERVPGPREFWSDEPNVEETDEKPTPVAEWGENRIISKPQAEKIAGTARTLQRWVKDGLLERVGRYVTPDESGRLRATAFYREQDVLTVKAAKDAEEKAGQFGGAP